MTTFGTIQRAIQDERALYVRERAPDGPRYRRIDPDDDITFQPLGSEAVRFTTDETRHEIECADIAIEPPPDVRAGVYGQS